MTEGDPPPQPKRKRIRRRRSRPRKRTVATKRLTRELMRLEWIKLGIFTDEERHAIGEGRPRTWGDCRDMPRPCPYVGCSHHLYLDVSPETGSITMNFPDLEPWEMKESCSLDVTARGGITLEEIGDIMNLTRERIRQIEVRALVRKARPTAELLGLNEVEIGKMRQSALADAEDIEPGIMPSDVSFVP